MQIFNRPAIIDEAAKASMSPKKIEKGKKPGLNIILEILTLIAGLLKICIVVPLP